LLQAKLAKLPGFPPELKTLLEHMIISHHGQYDFGSPKLPMFPEALMLHYLDDLDSKMESMRAHFERESELEGPWTSYNASLDRPLLDSRKFLRGEKAQAARTGAEEPSAPSTTPRAESPTSSAPVVDLDLFSEQKA
jgi:3'-5' exoribonuclease